MLRARPVCRAAGVPGHRARAVTASAARIGEAFDTCIDDYNAAALALLGTKPDVVVACPANRDTASWSSQRALLSASGQPRVTLSRG